MRAMRRLVARLWNLATGRRGDDRLCEEMEQHLALQTDENVRAGMSPDEARRQAGLKFGRIFLFLEGVIFPISAGWSSRWISLARRRLLTTFRGPAG